LIKAAVLLRRHERVHKDLDCKFRWKKEGMMMDGSWIDCITQSHCSEVVFWAIGRNFWLRANFLAVSTQGVFFAHPDLVGIINMIYPCNFHFGTLSSYTTYPLSIATSTIPRRTFRSVPKEMPSLAQCPSGSQNHRQ
jgi:hypothetical protein